MREKWRQGYSFFSVLPILPLSPRRMDLLNSGGETCSQRESEREKEEGYFSFWQQRRRARDGQTRTESILSPAVSAHCLRCWCTYGGEGMGGIRDLMVVPQRRHTSRTQIMTHSIVQQTSAVTPLPPEFTRNQLRLSKKGEIPPPPLCPSPPFISALLQLFIPLLFLLFNCAAMTSSALLFCSKLRLNAHFLSSPKTKRRQTRSHVLLLTVPSPRFSSYSLPHTQQQNTKCCHLQLHAW